MPRRDRLSSAILLAATVIVVALCIAIALPFVPPLTWAVVLALLTWPLHIRLQRRIRNRSVAALASVLVVSILLLGPIVWISFRVSNEIAGTIRQMHADIQSGAFEAGLHRHRALSNAYQWLNDRIDFATAGLRLADGVKTQLAHFIGSTIRTIVELFICLFILFFFLRDRAQILGALRSRLPLRDDEIQLLLFRLKNIIRATVFGRMITAIVQGILGGIMFWILGIDAALLWTIVMAALSMIPAVGSVFVWAPAAAWLALSGHWVKAIILAVWGSAVVGTIDNILYPLLVGRDVRVHTLLLFIALLGGVLLFGATGLVLGPVLMETGLTLIEIVRSRTQGGELESGRG